MYAKVFKGMFYGSLSGQSDPQLVLVCLLTHCDRDGNVELPEPLIASMTGLGAERVEAAIRVLESPDDGSRSDERDGRRIERFGPGRWNVVNYLKYRAMRDEDERREQAKEGMRRSRKAKRLAIVSQKLAAVSQGDPRLAQGEGEGEAEAEEKTLLSPGGDVNADFLTVWQEYPHYGHRSSKAKSLARWRALRPRPSLDEVLLGLRACASSDDWTREGGRFVPACEVWIGKRGWDSSNGVPAETVDPLARARRLLAEKEAQREARRS